MIYPYNNVVNIIKSNLHFRLIISLVFGLSVKTMCCFRIISNYPKTLTAIKNVFDTLKVAQKLFTVYRLFCTLFLHF